MDLPTSSRRPSSKRRRGVSIGGLDRRPQAHRRSRSARANRADFRNNLGLVLSDSDPEGAIAAFREAVAIQPNLALAHKNLAMMLAPRRRVR